MATDCIAQIRFTFETDVVVKFDVPDASADGGAVLLKAVDGQLGVTEAVASSLRDRRQPGKVQHEVIDLVRQRIFGLACGYADGNDAARLATMPCTNSCSAAIRWPGRPWPGSPPCRASKMPSGP
jgi:hypothetical protein